MYSVVTLALAATTLAAPSLLLQPLTGEELKSPTLPNRVKGPGAIRPPTATKAQTVLYWGQNSEKVIENGDLTAYCKKDSGVDIILLSFLSQYGKGTLIGGGNFDRSCGVEAGTGKPTGCEYLTKQIKTCQDAGVKVFLSVGGGETGKYALGSTDEAEKVAQNIWDAYGPVGKSTIPRPFGDVVLDGFDFDIELDHGHEFYPDLVNKLRSNFPKDGKFFLSAAPQCILPDASLNDAIVRSQFDYLFVQFYNNGACAATASTFNYNQWKQSITNTKSKDAKLFIGLPASQLAYNQFDNRETYYLKPDELATLVNKYKSDSAFGGIMAWSAGSSDGNVQNNCTYMQNTKSILTTGKPC